MNTSDEEDDIVTELRDWATIVDGVQGKAMIAMLSGSIFAEAADEIEQLEAELASQRLWAELMSGNNCYCVSSDVDPGMCAPCAYRLTMRQNEEARRG